MATDGALPSKADFEEYVRARQRTLLRAAFLVCGNEERSVVLLRSAVAAAARHWDQVRHADPDLFVRRVLYRDAIKACRARRPGMTPAEPVGVQPTDASEAGDVRYRLEEALSEPVWDEPDDSWKAEEARRRRTMLAALDTLSGRQRAVLVLRFFDGGDEHDTSHTLGFSPGTVRAETRDAMGGLRAALPSSWFPASGPSAGDLGMLLQLASDDVSVVDVTDGTWEDARRRHRAVVRRTVLGVGAVATAGVALVMVRGPTPAPNRARVDSTRAVGADGRLRSVQVHDVTVFLAPEPRAEAMLGRFPGAAELGLPHQLGPGDPSARAVLGEGVAEPIRAVFLVQTSGGDLSPVLLVHGTPPRKVLVPGVVLGTEPTSPLLPGDVRLRDGRPPRGTETCLTETRSMALDPRTIARDRHRVVFVAGGRLLVLDARTGSVTELEVPDRTLTTAGWARDGVTVISHGRYDSWVVDPVRGSVRRTANPVHAGWADLTAGAAAAVLRTFSESGEVTGGLALPGPRVIPDGASVSDEEGWVAASAYLPGDYQVVAQATQGLLSLQRDAEPRACVLAASRSALVPSRCYRALAWASDGVVLFESRSERTSFGITVRRILAWDVPGARLWRLADLERVTKGVGRFTGSYAV